MAATRRHRSLLDLPPELQEMIFIFAIGPYDDITDSTQFAQTALNNLTALRLTSPHVHLSTPFLKQSHLKLQFLLSPSYPSLNHLPPSPYLTSITIPSLNTHRTEFPPRHNHPTLLLHLPILHELHLSLNTLHFPHRHQTYWKTSTALRSSNKQSVKHAALSTLTPRLHLVANKTTLTIRFNVQHDLRHTGMKPLSRGAISHVYFTLVQLYLGEGRWREVSHEEVLHVHANGRRWVGMWGLKEVPGLHAYYGDGWVWRKSVEERVLVSREGWGCDCFAGE